MSYYLWQYSTNSTNGDYPYYSSEYSDNPNDYPNHPGPGNLLDLPGNFPDHHGDYLDGPGDNPDHPGV